MVILSGEMEAKFPDVKVGLVVIFDCVCVNMKKKHLPNKFNNIIIKIVANNNFLNTLKVHIENILKDINNNTRTSA